MDEWSGVKRRPVTANKYIYADLTPPNGADPSGYFTLASVIQGLSINIGTRVQSFSSKVRLIGNTIKVAVLASMTLNYTWGLLDGTILQSAILTPSAIFDVHKVQYDIMSKIRKLTGQAMATRAASSLTRFSLQLIGGRLENYKSLGTNKMKPTGFPDFSGHLSPSLPLPLFIGKLGSGREADKVTARGILRRRLIKLYMAHEYRWHHHEVVGIMQLVDKAAHGVPHIGGVFYHKLAYPKYIDTGL